jgi:threonine/homoserine/homoserine lactone efflux protein
MNSASLATLALVLLLGAMSPGPSFWLVVQLALGQSRRVALGAALGMGLGAVCFAMLAASGWQSWLPPLWLQGVRLAGAAFLCWLGYRMWRGAGHSAAGGVDAMAGGAGWQPGAAVQS